MKRIIIIIMIQILLVSACTDNNVRPPNDTDNIIANVSENLEDIEKPVSNDDIDKNVNLTNDTDNINTNISENLKDTEIPVANVDIDKNVNATNDTDNINSNIPGDLKDTEKPVANDDIDRTEYLTGEIITDKNYSLPSLFDRGVIYFIPDEESSKIIKDKYDKAAESFILTYYDMSKVENLPHELGISKARVKIEWHEKDKAFSLNDIQLTDKIGTVTYVGKTYETNELDENVKVKDKVCGLIVKSIYKYAETDSIIISFAGEIESEGYFSINYSLPDNNNFGIMYLDEKYFETIPKYEEKELNFFYFNKSNELFDELENFSSFGRVKIKTSNFHLAYSLGRWQIPENYLTEIISLDESYKNLFKFDKNKLVGRVSVDKDFIIVSSDNLYDDNYLSTDFYYVNKDKPEKIFLFNSLNDNYKLKVTAAKNEFILSTNGYHNHTGEQNEENSIICKVTDYGVITTKIKGLSIDSCKIDDTGKSFNIQGNIENIIIQENKVFMSIKDIKMKDEDALAFGKTLKKDDLLEILIIDNNSSGPFISVGDKIMVSCRYTKDNEILYTYGADIRSYE